MTMFLNVGVEPGGADKRFAADVAGAEPRIACVIHVLAVRRIGREFLPNRKIIIARCRSLLTLNTCQIKVENIFF